MQMLYPLLVTFLPEWARSLWDLSCWHKNESPQRAATLGAILREQLGILFLKILRNVKPYKHSNWRRLRSTSV